MAYITEDTKWISFYPVFCSGFYVEKAGYFDERPEITTGVTQIIVLFLIIPLLFYSAWFVLLLPFILFGWGRLYIHLPIHTGIQDCESAAYGINYHSNKLWIYIGGGGNFSGGKKWKTITMPWEMEWVRTSLMLRDTKSWVHETKVNRISLYEDVWKNPKLVFIETHPYTYVKKNGDVQNVNATITVEEREWRPLWFQWTSLLKSVSRTIAVEFDAEVGERTGSWKGGVIGCGYPIKPNESPLECLRRMERERKFN